MDSFWAFYFNYLPVEYLSKISLSVYTMLSHLSQWSIIINHSPMSWKNCLVCSVPGKLWNSLRPISSLMALVCITSVRKSPNCYAAKSNRVGLIWSEGMPFKNIHELHACSYELHCRLKTHQSPKGREFHYLKKINSFQLITKDSVYSLQHQRCVVVNK